MITTFSTSLPACDLYIVGATKAFADELQDLDKALGGGLTDWLSAESFDGSAGTVHSIPTLGKLPAKHLTIIGTGDGSDDAVSLGLAKAAKAARKAGHAEIAVRVATPASVAFEALAIGNYQYDAYLNEKKRKPAFTDVCFVGTDSDDALVDAKTRAKWQQFARDLVNGPPADIYPMSLAAKATEAVAGMAHTSAEVIDFETCREKGMVGVIAVGQGSANPGCLIHLSYHPPGATEHIALVGKGVTFDSGGLSLKPSGAMQTMRCDMGGAAVALSSFGAIAELGLNIKVDCYVGAVENMCGANSYKLGDILRYRNGVTVEIHNTDAEGRLVLADALIEACASGATQVIDLATLTGACVVAVGEDFTGLFTNDEGMATDLMAAAKANGEGLWRLPLHKPYNDLLKTPYSQIKNVGSRAAGATTAALFLSHFVTDDVRWAHLDVAGTAFHDKGSRMYAPGGTGQMVRSLVSWAAGVCD